MNTSKILDDLAIRTYSHLKSASQLDYGLLNGNLGEVIFLYYYSSINETYREKADLLLDKLLNSLNQNNYGDTYCGGLAGLGIGLNLLEKNGYIEDLSDALNDIDLFLEYKLQYNFASNNHDFLHGFIGIGFYFLMRYQSKKDFSTAQLIKIISYLGKTALSECDTIKWHLNDIQKGYNISLSHGAASTLILLSRISLLDLTQEYKQTVIRLINGTIHYILAQQIDPQKYGSFFPSLPSDATNIISRSRLAWCYGDLGIALSLWQAGNILKRDEIINKSIKILEYNAINRRNQLENLVYDAEICHGASGIAQIFYHLYAVTKNPVFSNAYNYWKECVLNMAYYEKEKDSFTFKTYNVESNLWEDKTCILDGISGIGLFLLSENNSNWDELLLL